VASLVWAYGEAAEQPVVVLAVLVVAWLRSAEASMSFVVRELK